MIWMQLEPDVAYPTRSIRVPLSDKSDIFCNVADDGWLDFDGLCLKPCQRLDM